MDIYELADMLSDEIDLTGKTRWSAKDVKEFFLSHGIDLSLDEIMKVWDTCSNPVCACELLGCDDAIFASEDIEPYISKTYREALKTHVRAIINILERLNDSEYEMVNDFNLDDNGGRYSDMQDWLQYLYSIKV